MYTPMIQFEGDLSAANVQQLKYLIWRLMKPSMPKHEAAILAGYSEKQAKRKVGELEKLPHIERILAKAAEARNELPQPNGKPSREEVIANYAAIFRNEHEETRIRLKAADDLRQMEAYDKSRKPDGRDANVFLSIIHTIRDNSVVLPSHYRKYLGQPENMELTNDLFED